MISETAFLAYWRILARLRGATIGEASRCWRAGFTVAEAASVLAVGR